MKYLTLSIFIAGLIFCGIETNAGIHHLVDDASSSSNRKNTKSNDDNVKFTVSSVTKCREAGYQKFSCPEDYNAISPCPFNNKLYRYCCPPDYQYSADECRAKGLTPSDKTCNGQRACL